MLISDWVHIPVAASLAVIVVAVGSSVVLSLVLTRGKEADAAVLAAAGHGDSARRQEGVSSGGGLRALSHDPAGSQPAPSSAAYNQVTRTDR